MVAFTEWHLERYRPLLRLLVRRIQLDPRLQPRFDSSDLVQETLLKAEAQLDRFRGQSEAQLVKWLHEILEHTVTDQIRKARARVRNVAQEQSLQAVLGESSDRLHEFLASGQPTPIEEAERRRPASTSVKPPLGPEEANSSTHWGAKSGKHYVSSTGAAQSGLEGVPVGSRCAWRADFEE
jgi:RNA polymerase sigma factor (sigma-70 family)